MAYAELDRRNTNRIERCVEIVNDAAGNRYKSVIIHDRRSDFSDGVVPIEIDYVLAAFPNGVGPDTDFLFYAENPRAYNTRFLAEIADSLGVPLPFEAAKLDERLAEMLETHPNDADVWNSTSRRSKKNDPLAFVLAAHAPGVVGDNNLVALFVPEDMFVQLSASVLSQVANHKIQEISAAN